MSVQDMQRAFGDKQAETLPNNEDATTVGAMNVYPNPSDRKPGTLDARWGDKPTAPVENSEAVEREARNDRVELLGRLFDTLEPARENEKKLMSAQFSTQNYEAHSPLLQPKVASVLRPDATLADQVSRVVGLP